MKIIVPVLVLLAAAGHSGCKKHENSERIAMKANQANFETKSSEKEAAFVVETISENYGTLKFAQMAENLSTNTEVKDIAMLVERDQQRLIRELKGFANMRGISIPLEENKQARRKLDMLERNSGKTFDEKWCRELRDRHAAQIEKLEVMWENPRTKSSKRGSTAHCQAFAQAS